MTTMDPVGYMVKSPNYSRIVPKVLFVIVSGSLVQYIPTCK